MQSCLQALARAEDKAGDLHQRGRVACLTSVSCISCGGLPKIAHPATKVLNGRLAIGTALKASQLQIRLASNYPGTLLQSVRRLQEYPYASCSTTAASISPQTADCGHLHLGHFAWPAVLCAASSMPCPTKAEPGFVTSMTAL